MTELEIELMGRVEIENDTKPVSGFQNGKLFFTMTTKRQ
jgi:hypothetical protein